MPESPRPSGAPAGGRDLITLMRMKQAAAVDRESPQEGFTSYKSAAGYLPDSDQLRLKPLRGLRDFAVEQALAFHQVAPAGEAFVNAPPTVVGDGNHHELMGATRSMFVACLANADIRGRSAVIDLDNVVLLDFENDELSNLDDQLELDPAIFQATNETAWVMTAMEAVSIEFEEAFTLLGPHTYSFGHWMWEYLPKYVVATLSGVLQQPVPVLIDAGMPATHRQALEQVLPRGTDVVEIPPFRAARVRRLWCAPTLMYMPLLEKMNERFKWDYLASSPARFAPVIREMNRRVACACDLSGTGPKRIFLARRAGRHRKLVNHLVIEACARERGFAIVYPEDLQFADQVRLLHHARFVIGPEGSAMFLAYFSSAGTRLCILNHPHTAGLAIYNALLGAIGIEVTALTGPCVRRHEEYLHFADYEIEPEAFCRFLDAWLNEGAK